MRDRETTSTDVTKKMNSQQKPICLGRIANPDETVGNYEFFKSTFEGDPIPFTKQNRIVSNKFLGRPHTAFAAKNYITCDTVNQC